MTSIANKLSDQQKEVCAVAVMRSMLEDYCDETGMRFDHVLFQFTSSPVYKMLFDYSTGLWREGPDYLREMFKETL